jgi:hypothetical protein
MLMLYANTRPHRSWGRNNSSRTTQIGAPHRSGHQMFIQGKSTTHAAHAKVQTRAVTTQSGRSTNHLLKLPCQIGRGRPQRWYRLNQPLIRQVAELPNHIITCRIQLTHTGMKWQHTAREDTYEGKKRPPFLATEANDGDVAPDSIHLLYTPPPRLSKMEGLQLKPATAQLRGLQHKAARL